MDSLKNKILTFAADKAQDISQGIYEDAVSLAEALDAGTVTADEARKQFAEMQSRLEEAAAE